MKERCLLPSTLEELQEELKNQGISLQKFFLDENIDPQQRHDILLNVLGTEEQVKFFEDTVYENILAPALQKQAQKELEKENIKKNIIDDMVMNRIRRLRGRMSPEYESMYLEKLVQEDMKMALNQEQAESLVEAQNSVEAALEDLNIAISEAKDENGNALFDVKSYKDIYKEVDVQKIRDNDKLYKKYLTLGLAIRKYQQTHADISQDILSKGIKAVGQKILGSTRSAILSADLSFGRNISNMFFVKPGIGFKSWWKGASRTFTDLWYGTQKDANGYTKQDYAWAEIYAHPNVISGRLKQLGVNIGITEEQFLNSYITQFTEKSEEYSRSSEKTLLKVGATAIRPILRLYSASESGFNMAVNMARFMYANTMIDLYDAKTKADIKVLKENGIGDLIMEQTGRWNGLKGDKALVDKISFYVMAMRWTMSRIATAKNIKYIPATIVGAIKPIRSLDAFYFNKQNVDKGRSALGLVIAMPLIAALISAGLNDDDEKDYWEKVLDSWDLTGDYGKVVFGKTRFDLTFGLAPVVTTVAKTIKQMLNPQYGKDAWDPVARFIRNRQAPIISIITGAYEHGRTIFDDSYLPKDIMGQPETAGAFIRGMLLPIYVDSIIQNFGGDRDEDISTLEASAAIFSDIIGIGAVTYSDKASKSEILEKWGKASPLAQISKSTNLYKKLSHEEFIKAEKEMETMYMSEANKLMKSAKYKSMSRDKRDAELQKIHRKITDKLSEKYGVKKKTVEKK
jgi:hypothetical protein